jgi:hypothetical protein
MHTEIIFILNIQDYGFIHLTVQIVINHESLYFIVTI